MIVETLPKNVAG
jgi:hypothetical protein